MLTPLTTADIPWITAHMHEHYPPAYTYLWTDHGAWYVANMYNETKLREEFSDQNARFYRVEDPHGVYGYCKVIHGKSPARKGKYTNYFYLQRLYLATQAQGKGIGRRVVEILLEQARTTGHDAVWLETMEVGRSKVFYQRFGFEKIDVVRLPFPGMHDHLRDLAVMERPLNHIFN
ncbi:MAG: GNAT family N-acetyltransferase [Bacteroidota bacterium]